MTQTKNTFVSAHLQTQHSWVTNRGNGKKKLSVQKGVQHFNVSSGNASVVILQQVHRVSVTVHMTRTWIRFGSKIGRPQWLFTSLELEPSVLKRLPENMPLKVLDMTHKSNQIENLIKHLITKFQIFLTLASFDSELECTYLRVSRYLQNNDLIPPLVSASLAQIYF